MLLVSQIKSDMLCVKNYVLRSKQGKFVKSYIILYYCFVDIGILTNFPFHTRSIHFSQTNGKIRAVVNIQSTLYEFDIGEICEYPNNVEVVPAFV